MKKKPTSYQTGAESRTIKKTSEKVDCSNNTRLKIDSCQRVKWFLQVFAAQKSPAISLDRSTPQSSTVTVHRYQEQVHLLWTDNHKTTMWEISVCFIITNPDQGRESTRSAKWTFQYYSSIRPVQHLVHHLAISLEYCSLNIAIRTLRPLHFVLQFTSALHQDNGEESCGEEEKGGNIKSRK